eukprot:5805022-Ditylum_brightwellii.AAC.1
MEVPQGFEAYYPPHVLLLLLRIIYGLKQAAIQFWRELLNAMKHMKFQRNKADPCLYYKWVGSFLILWVSWVDDCLVAGLPKLVKNAKTEMTGLFECKELGEMEEYIGYKVERDLQLCTIKLMQPALLQS